jgi:hypothetical protein
MWPTHPKCPLISLEICLGVGSKVRDESVRRLLKYSDKRRWFSELGYSVRSRRSLYVFIGRTNKMLEHARFEIARHPDKDKNKKAGNGV